MNNNGKKLLDKMSEADPKLIADAYKKPHRKSRLFIGLTSGMATVAAAAMIAVAAGQSPAPNPPVVDDPISSSGTSTPGTSDSNIDNNSGTSSTQTPMVNDPPELDFSKYKDLPKITDITNYGATGSGGGAFRSSMKYKEFECASPWNGAGLETMPVYMSGSTEIPDLDKMYARVKEIAAALGISADKLEITDTYEDMSKSIEQQRELGKQAGATDEEIEEVINRMIRSVMSSVIVNADADGISICLTTDYCALICFEKPIELPKEYNFTDSATAEERAEAISYLADRYKELTGYSDPMPGQYESFVYYGNYIYEADGDLTEQIVNYWLNTTQFKIDIDTGKLEKILIYSDAGCEKLADYPVLTAAQAEAILKSNKYSDPDRMPADAKIVKTDLVYRNAPGYTAVIPYYEFYVEADVKPGSGDDLVCDVYSIAAVPEEFIDVDTADYGAHA